MYERPLSGRLGVAVVLDDMQYVVLLLLHSIVDNAREDAGSLST